MHSEMCCQDRASSSILFHSSALSWSFSVAMFCAPKTSRSRRLARWLCIRGNITA